MKAPTVKQVLDRIDLMAPRALALPGDPVGLQCGDPRQPTRGIMLALDASGATVSQAVKARADLLVTHHPLLFEPLGPGTINGPGGRAYAQAVRAGLAVFSAHTNLDASPLGVNAAVASLFPLLETRPLQGTGPRPYKVVVFTPAATQEKIRRAVFEAGGGRIGAYSGCSFAGEGQGTFVPGEGSRPYLGQAGQAEKVQEVRQEFAVDGSVLARVLEAVEKVHPYEEPVVDVYPLETVSGRSGLGISGVLEERVSVARLAERLVLALRTRTMRLVG